MVLISGGEPLEYPEITEADSGDSGAWEARVFVHGWNIDPATTAHDSAVSRIFSGT